MTEFCQSHDYKKRFVFPLECALKERELIDFIGRGLSCRCHTICGNVDKGRFVRTDVVLCLQLSFVLI